MKGNSVRDLIEGPLTQQDEHWTVAGVHQIGIWKWKKL